MGRPTGSAVLPLHGGRVPAWLAGRMARLGRVITEAIILEYGRDELLRRLAHPFWFQSLGAVMGMDWHSSGITTSVLGALKRGLEPVAGELGLYVCGGRGRASRRTPDELRAVGELTGVDGDRMARTSRQLTMPGHHAVAASDVSLRRLHGALAAAEIGPTRYEDLLLCPGVGARTVEALALVAEVVHGAPSRFRDPARFACAHGGKDGSPFPVPLAVYDRTIAVMSEAVGRARIGQDDRMAALRELDRQARALESRARGPSLEELFARERRRAPELGGRTVHRDRPVPAAPAAQLSLPGVTPVAREPDKR